MALRAFTMRIVGASSCSTPRALTYRVMLTARLVAVRTNAFRLMAAAEGLANGAHTSWSVVAAHLGLLGGTHLTYLPRLSVTSVAVPRQEQSNRHSCLPSR